MLKMYAEPYIGIGHKMIKASVMKHVRLFAIREARWSFFCSASESMTV